MLIYTVVCPICTHRIRGNNANTILRAVEKHLRIRHHITPRINSEVYNSMMYDLRRLMQSWVLQIEPASPENLPTPDETRQKEIRALRLVGEALRTDDSEDLDLDSLLELQRLLNELGLVKPDPSRARH